MIRCLLLAVLLEPWLCAATTQTNDLPLVQRPWFETRTRISTSTVAARPGRLQTFRASGAVLPAYTLMAGAQAVASRRLW